MITIKDNDRMKMIARTIKPSSALNKKDFRKVRDRASILE